MPNLIAKGNGWVVVEDTDDRGQEYVEVDLPCGDKVRMTYQKIDVASHDDPTAELRHILIDRQTLGDWQEVDTVRLSNLDGLIALFVYAGAKWAEDPPKELPRVEVDDADDEP